MWKLGGGSNLLTAGIAFANCLVFDAAAQTYPNKPIRIVVGFGTGGGTDATARAIGQRLWDETGQPVVIENRPGADGSIATRTVAKAPPDGYTLLMMASADTIHPALRSDLPYNVERDFAPVSLVVIGPYVLVVHPSVPARTVKELIALARSQPGKLNFASLGVGSTTHLAGELVNSMAKVHITQVPFKSGADAAVATAGGHVTMTMASITSVMPLVESKRLRLLAVTSGKRASALPSVPTLSESGLTGYDRSTWYGVVAPASVPKEIIVRLNSLIDKVADTPDMKAMMGKFGFDVQTNTPEQFAAFIKRELVQNAELVKLIGLKPE